jgi:hypothetical protein
MEDCMRTDSGPCRAAGTKLRLILKYIDGVERRPDTQVRMGTASCACARSAVLICQTKIVMLASLHKFCRVSLLYRFLASYHLSDPLGGSLRSLPFVPFFFFWKWCCTFIKANVTLLGRPLQELCIYGLGNKRMLLRKISWFFVAVSCIVGQNLSKLDLFRGGPVSIRGSNGAKLVCQSQATEVIPIISQDLRFWPPCTFLFQILYWK